MFKFAPLNTTPIRVPSSDKSFYVAGGKRTIPQWQVVNEFNSSYYSGLDVSVYFGNIFLDECIQLQYSEMEQVRPIFGYADYTFRHVSHGARIVQGSFAINFKDAGYMLKLLEYLDDPDRVNDVIEHIAAQQIQNSSKMGDIPSKQIYQSTSENPNNGWPVTRVALSRDLSLEDIVNNDGASDPDIYRRIMDNLKRQHWGEAAVAPGTPNISSADQSAKYQVTPGVISVGFDIIIKYGQPEDSYGGKPGWGTLETIKDCHITGFQKTIDDSGRNVIENYNFIARTVI